MSEAFQRRWEPAGRRRRREAVNAEGATDAAKPPAETPQPGYHGVPVVHRTHWKWLIIVYFFLGGISGASYVVAAIAQLVGGPRNRSIVRTGRYISFAALLPCPVLLVLDLGRPERFYRMLRVVKFRSPMSLGTWGLSIFSLFSAGSVAIQAAEDGLLGRGRLAESVARVDSRAVGMAGTVPAFFFGGYTGVLLGATAVPLWSKNAMLLGPLFLTSAFSTAVAAIAVVETGRRHPDETAVARLEALDRIAIAAELALLAASRIRLGEIAKPVVTGRTGNLLLYGTVGAGLIAPLALHWIDRRRKTRGLSLLGSLLVLGGGFILRYASVVGGNASADDPQATFLTTSGKTRGKSGFLTR